MHILRGPKVNRPDYDGGSLVNLMSSIVTGLGSGGHAYAPLTLLPPARLRDVRNVVLLVLDGLGANQLARAAPGATLRAHQAGRITSVFPSTTASAITTFLTGEAPQQHAITGWYMYVREVGSIIAPLPFTARFGGGTLGEAGISAKELFGHKSVFDRLDVASSIVVPKRIAHSDFNLAHSGRAHVRPYRTLRGLFRELRAALRQPGRRFVYAYWPEIDAHAHRFGVDSVEVARQIAGVDAGFARFLERIAGSGALVIVTADHGLIDQRDVSHIELGDHPALADTLVLPLCGERRVAYCYVAPGRTAQFERYVQEELGSCVELLARDELLASGLFGAGTPHPELGARIGDYALLMSEGHTIKDWLTGEQPYAHIGTHGGLSDDELYVPLIAVQV